MFPEVIRNQLCPVEPLLIFRFGIHEDEGLDVSAARHGEVATSVAVAMAIKVISPVPTKRGMAPKLPEAPT